MLDSEQISNYASLGIGATSLLVQVAQGCVTGFSLWHKADAIGLEALVFKIRLANKEALLRAWMFQWGIEQGTMGYYFNDAKFEQFQDEAVQALLVIHSILASLHNLDSEFPVVEAAGTTSVSAASSFANLRNISDPNAPERQYFVKKMEQLKNDASVNERLRWSLSNGKATATVEMVGKLIDDIYQLLPPPAADPTAPVVFNPTLSSNNAALLDAVNQTKADPLLEGLAGLRWAIFQLKSRSNALQAIKVNRSARALTVTESDEANNRATGMLDKQMVLVEWKLVDSSDAESAGLGPMYRTLMQQRIKDVARLLASRHKPPELRTLPCLGVITQPAASETDQTYGLVYQTPAKSFITLLDAISSQNRRYVWELGDRFSSAVTLAKAVLYLHLAGWLHKGVRSENILFFPDDTGPAGLGKPYLVGFEYTRESEPNSQTEAVDDRPEWNLYRHPEVQGVPVAPPASENAEGSAGAQPPPRPTENRPTFSEWHDLYSAGVVLLEIGLIESVSSMLDRAKADAAYAAAGHSPETFRQRLIDVETPRLASSMGRGYCSAVRECLTGTFPVNAGRTLSQSFYVDVVMKLEDRHAA